MTIALTLTSCGRAFGAVELREHFGIMAVRQDFPWQLNGSLSAFFSDDYRTGSFDEIGTYPSTISVSRDRLTRIGFRYSTVLDLAHGTVTILDNQERAYSVLTVREFAKALKGHPFPQGRLSARQTNGSRTEQVSTIFSRAEKPSNIVAHAVTTTGDLLSHGELATFERHCFARYQQELAAVCSLHDPRAFGFMPGNLPAQEAFAGQAVVEWRTNTINQSGVSLFGLQNYDSDLPGSRVPVMEEAHKPWSIDPGPRLGVIMRAESRLEIVEPAGDSHAFDVPPGYHRVRSLKSYWTRQN